MRSGPVFWMSQMTMDMGDPGQDPRDAPDIASLWSVLGLTPAGRGLVSEVKLLITQLFELIVGHAPYHLDYYEANHKT